MVSIGVRRMVRAAIGGGEEEVKAIVERAGLSEAAVRTALKEMVVSGEVEEVGEIRPFRYKVVVKDSGPREEEKENGRKRERKILDIEVERNAEIIITIRAAAEIEDFFRRHSEDVGESQKWGTKFYRVRYDGEVKNFFSSRYDEYGLPFVNGGKVNVSVLRTVGISEGPVKIRMNNEYSEETLISAVKELKGFTKELYQRWIRKVVIRGKLEIEEVL